MSIYHKNSLIAVGLVAVVALAVGIFVYNQFFVLTPHGGVLEAFAQDCTGNEDCSAGWQCYHEVCTWAAYLRHHGGGYPGDEDYTKELPCINGNGLQVCSGNEDCQAHYWCINNNCLLECNGDEDCPAHQWCRGRNGYLVCVVGECGAASECPFGHTCYRGECVLDRSSILHLLFLILAGAP